MKQPSWRPLLSRYSVYSKRHGVTIRDVTPSFNDNVLITLTSYAPPRQHSLPRADLEFIMRHQTPAIFAGDLNCRHSHFGYRNGYNNKGRQLYQHIFNNRLNHVGPNFPTFYTRNSETKPDVVLTNRNFYLNQNVTSGGIGPSDHITINITVSAEPIFTQCPPHPDIKNTNWDKYKNINWDQRLKCQ